MVSDWKEATINDVHTMTSKANLSRRFSNVIIGLHSAAAFTYGIGVLVSNPEDHETDAIETPVREFTLKMQLPFECNESPFYELVMCLEFLHQLASSAVTGILNSLIITLVLHISGQIDIMRQGFLQISSKNHAPLAAIKVLINRHQRIIDLSDNIEDLFSNIALLQFIWNTLVICCIGFLIVISKSISDAAYECLWYDLTPSECRTLMFLMLRSQKRLTITAGKITDLSLEGFTTTINTTKDISTLIKSVNYYIAITLEAFIFCYAGEFLSSKSKSIGDAVYEMLWYNMPSNDSRILLFMMLRCQKRLTITAGKVIDLTLDGFASVRHYVL
ncbi:odorant receptor 13a [Lasius niger]|uniref:Odorant receptor 13a n=1 Tax=Lasius niger TaxID=67767 RepID=A0A0J7L4N8_LASNI|nr:odorant receptor 13a [Lasius niger]